MDTISPIHKHTLQSSTIRVLIRGLCWHLIHLLVTLLELALYLANVIRYYLISIGFFWNYKSLQLDTLQHLGIVIDSEEAVQTSKVKKLLYWLVEIGVKHVTLYDMEGILKESKKTFGQNLDELSINAWMKADKKAAFRNQKSLTLELLSISDGKEGVAKAAAFLCSNDLSGMNQDANQTEQIVKADDINRALRAVGCGGPEPNLLLIFGHARSSLGFPAWRLRYTEIVYMGTLKSMKFGAVVKVINDYSRKHQNYGS